MFILHFAHYLTWKCLPNHFNSLFIKSDNYKLSAIITNVNIAL